MDIINGVEAILHGFGRNPPPQEVAQDRSDICTGRLSGVPCPNNHKGSFSLTAQASSIIHAQRQRKLELKLAVEGESSLGVCRTCGCYLPLKVWFDSQTILDYTTDFTIAKFPDFCWIKKECHKLTTTREHP